MSKLLFIGIDSADSELLTKFQQYLPNFTRLKTESKSFNIQSVFPPDSDTAWATIYTGLSPAEHGVVEFLDPLNKSMKIQHVEKDNTKIAGKTFWDIAGRKNKKVCIINPHLGFPTWPVNGIMVGRSNIEDKIDTYPKDLIEEYPELNNLITPRGFPGNEKLLCTYVESYKRVVKSEIDIGVKLLKTQEWDLFFIYSSALDAIQHYFWDYMDNGSVSNKHDFKNVIREFYILHDEMIGKLCASVDKDTVIIVASDHGHGMRPQKLLNVNEYLRINRYYCIKKKSSNPAPFVVEKTKKTLLNIVDKYRLENTASKILKIFPVGKKIYTTPLSVDWTKTMAYISDLSGIKSYSYGGIIINKNNLGDTNYEKLRTDIINGLMDITDPDTGEKVIKWICRREDLYHGPHINQYPDILFDMKYGYGAGWDTECPLFGKSKTHNFVPGSHRGETPILFIDINRDVPIVINSLGDINNNVLKLMDL